MTASSLQFDYDHFVELSGDSLIEYADPLASSLDIVISPEDIDRLKAHLDAYDEYHLVYAIEIGTDNAPSDFASEIPRFLGHEQASVFCVADRVLRRLATEFLTPSLISEVEKIAKVVPDRRAHIEALAESLRNKLM